MITLGPANTLSAIAGTASAVTCSIFGDNVAGAGSSAIDAFGMLYQGQLSNSAATLLFAAAGNQRLIKSILLTNVTGSAVSGIKFFSNGNAAANQLVTLTIPANGSATWTDSKGWTVYDSTGTALTTVAGVVTSVGLALPAIFTVSGSPVTTTGTLTAALATQAANLVFAGPVSGAAAAPTFRAQVLADMPAGLALLASSNAFTAAQGGPIAYGTTTSATVSINLAALGSSTGVTWTSGPPASANTVVLTLANAVTSLAYTNAVDGFVYNLYLVENGTGGFAVTLPANFSFGSAGSPTLTTVANAINLISSQWLNALSKFKCAANPG